MTLKDIADLAGVSMMTVSNVINGKTSRVSQKTRDKVNAIIEEYGYVPNLNARSLSNKKSHIIGIIISLDEKDVLLGTNYFENPYVSTMVGAIERELQKNEYFTMIRSVSKKCGHHFSSEELECRRNHHSLSCRRRIHGKADGFCHLPHRHL